MHSGLSNVSLSFKTNIIYLWRHQDTKINQGNLKAFVTYFIFWIYEMWDFENGKVRHVQLELSEVLEF